MASPVDTSVKFFHSMMANAPLPPGAAGAGIALFDACLKDGFDVKSATITVAGGVATVAWTGSHSCLKDTVIMVAGVTGPMTALNGEQKVTARPSATSCTFATTVADGAASGTITIKMAPLNWAKPFAGTNLAVYQSQSAASAKHLLRVDDTSTTLMRVVGYESMSDVNTGAGAFPTAAQIAGGLYWPKRQAAGAAGVPWMIVGDERMFYFICCPFGASPTNWAAGNATTRGFGDPIILKPSGDAFATMLCGSQQSSVSSMQDGDFFNPSNSAISTPRIYTGNGSAFFHYAAAYCGGGNNASGVAATLGAFPNGIDGALYLSKKYLVASGSDGSPRADIPGVRHIPQSNTLNNFAAGDPWPGGGLDAGRTFMAVPCTNTSLSATPNVLNTGYGMIDITGPWR
ncbi:hypothetical protein [uncultured Variovorax sp.]|uniref:hypothetical protein n=1 Tax=uncultured Variovorax sp. TaxID=114708 RepID=UPI0025F55062|nr:hypothetical protein [uncultured Variovorax sp.]